MSKKRRRRRSGSILSDSEYKKLHKLYTNLSSKSAYGNVNSLQKASGLSQKKVLEYLHSSNVYTKFKTPIKRFKRLHALSNAVNEIWSADLAYVDKLAGVNKNIRYLFVAVDILSRFLYVQPMKTKTADEAKKALEKVVENAGVIPHKIWVDKGTEFRGSFKRYCNANGIIVYNTHSETKSAYAERYIRTLKNLIYKYIKFKDSYKYIDQLQKFVDVINNRVNTATGIAPSKVTTKHTHYLKTLAVDNQTSEPKFKRFDTVRIAKSDIAFRKGYKPQFTEEVFIIDRISANNPPTYHLKDKDGGVILGRFYEPELVKYAAR